MGRTLLLVDDEIFVLKALGRILRHDGYRILAATSGEEALKLLSENEVQVVLSDQRMPSMSGPQMLAQVAEHYPDAIRMVLSGYADFASITDAINRGSIYKFLFKPWNDELLRENIREAFDRYDLVRKGNQFTKIYENTVEAIVIIESTGCVQAVNPAFSAITGYESNEIVGKSTKILRSHRHDARYYRSMLRSLIGEGKWAGEIWNRRKDGSIFPAWMNITAIHDRSGNLSQYVGLFTDVTQHKQAEEKLRYQAFHDALTQLPNRMMYSEHLELAIQQADRRQQMCGVIMLDLDRFKDINDIFGHDFGDKLLIQVAGRLQESIRKGDTLARMGGDEFTLLLPLVDEVGDVACVATKILNAFESAIEIDGKELFITPSIGISLFPRDGKDAETLLKNSDAAMYKAKERGRNTYQFFTDGMNKAAKIRIALECDLRRSIERNELQIHYQPKVSLDSGKVVAAEALIRWHHSERGFVMPSELIPLSEDNGMILQIGEWVLQSVCNQIRAWRDSGIDVPPIAVNLSARQFQRQNLPDLLSQILVRSHIDADSLELELTEGAVMSKAESNIEMLTRLKRMGLSLAIDDFGTGYSSLSYLKRFPIDLLKIDHSFVRDIATDANSAGLVRSIIEMAHGLNLEVVAEGVETRDQLDFLYHNRCDMIQGFLFSRALTAEKFSELLKEGRRLELPIGYMRMAS